MWLGIDSDTTNTSAAVYDGKEIRAAVAAAGLKAEQVEVVAVTGGLAIQAYGRQQAPGFTDAVAAHQTPGTSR